MPQKSFLNAACIGFWLSSQRRSQLRLLNRCWLSPRRLCRLVVSSSLSSSPSSSASARLLASLCAAASASECGSQKMDGWAFVLRKRSPRDEVGRRSRYCSFVAPRPLMIGTPLATAETSVAVAVSVVSVSVVAVAGATVAAAARRAWPDQQRVR